MMTTAQERALRRLLKVGGKLRLPGFLAPITLHVERADPAALGKDVAHPSITEGDFLVCRYRRWNARDLYPLVAERLEDLVTGDAA
ncbi:hypothetical protein LG302_00870 [Halomonas organivorans]